MESMIRRLESGRTEVTGFHFEGNLKLTQCFSPIF